MIYGYMAVTVSRPMAAVLQVPMLNVVVGGLRMVNPMLIDGLAGCDGKELPAEFNIHFSRSSPMDPKPIFYARSTTCSSHQTALSVESIQPSMLMPKRLRLFSAISQPVGPQLTSPPKGTTSTAIQELVPKSSGLFYLRDNDDTLSICLTIVPTTGSRLFLVLTPLRATDSPFYVPGWIDINFKLFSACSLSQRPTVMP
jgi:hypothetical protein